MFLICTQRKGLGQHPKVPPLIDIRRFSLLPLGKTNKFVLPSLNRNVVKGGFRGNVASE